MAPSDERRVSRRDFVKSAVAIGGVSAFSACLSRERALLNLDGHDDEQAQFPRGSGPDALPSRQHAWNDVLVRNAHGNTLPPAHQLVLGLDYKGASPPTDAEHEQVERALATIERAFQWGTGGKEGVLVNRGLLTMLGYAPQYFERVGGSVDLMTPAVMLDELGEDEATDDGFDAVMILGSDVGSIVLGAEAALFGEVESVNGLDVTDTFEGVFSLAERRSGVVGKGLPADHLDNEDMPESAPLSMGFRSSFQDNQAPEDRVTIQEGPFAGGTKMQVSRLHIDLDRWYEQDTESRVAEMFCPAHDPEEVGETGAKLGSTSGITRSDVERLPEDAETNGRIGHSQKVARARDDDFVPRILRRSEGVATDVTDGAGFNFSSIQRDLQAFLDARDAMDDDYDDTVADEHSGIVDYLETVTRGTYLVPPRERRALPQP